MRHHGHHFIACAILAIAPPVALAGSATPDDAAVIPAWTFELERRLQPWCQSDCALLTPFVATYRSRGQVLVFVGVRHVFTSENPTLRAVDSGFSTASPAIVVVEGFPTEMGESPPPLVQAVRTRGTADADDFARGEAIYAASLAVRRGIPFIGGEPTRREQVGALARKGYEPADIAFSYLLGGLSQSLRAGDLADTSDPGLTAVFARWSGGFANQYKLAPMSLEEFERRYRSMFGVDLASDTQLVARSDIATTTVPALAALHQADMITRDEHLLATIERQLASRKRVLVVYGGSHWTTLAQALEKKLGKPQIRPFTE